MFVHFLKFSLSSAALFVDRIGMLFGQVIAFNHWICGM